MRQEDVPPEFIEKIPIPQTIKSVSGYFNVTHQCTIPPNLLKINLKTDTTFGIYKFHTFFNGIIGHDTLEQNDSIIDYKNKEITLNGTKYPIYYENDDENKKELNPTNKVETLKIDTLEKIKIGELEVNKNETQISRQPQVFTLEELEGIGQLRLEHLNKEEKYEIRKLIDTNEDIFYKKGDDLTFTNEIKHRIETKSDEPIYTRKYRYPAAFEQEISDQMKELLEQGIIQHSKSPYNAPIWPVPKKADKEGNKSLRIVIDFRKLNEQTKEDKYPIPRIDDILDKLGRANYFSTLDLTKGFYQIEVDPRDREKTAFTINEGHFEFIRMPFGLKNAPATFQRMMNNVLHEHH